MNEFNWEAEIQKGLDSLENGNWKDGREVFKKWKDKRVARICHEINRAYCEAIGDNSQVSWEDAPEWQKESAINGVQFVLNNPDAPPSSNHDNWLKVKLEDGWKYGPVKDPDKKEHPCCVPYDELPLEQKVKDYLFRAVVHVMDSI